MSFVPGGTVAALFCLTFCLNNWVGLSVHLPLSWQKWQKRSSIDVDQAGILNSG